MITVEHATRLIEALRTSGRLHAEDHGTIARALLIIIDRPGDFSSDPVEALVSVIGSLTVADAEKGAA